MDCLIWSEWKSSSKIIARCGIAYGLGDVIVFTKSGGIGTCTVQFRSTKDMINPTKESSVWVNEDEYFFYINNMHRNSVSPTFYQEDPLGLKQDETQTNIVRPKLKDTVIYDFFPEVQADENESSFSDFCSLNFLPAWYLLENYSYITFNDLKNAFKYLKEKNNNSKSVKPEDESIKLLKPNVLAVIECLDSLKAVNLAFKKDKQELGNELTLRIEDSINKAAIEAHEIFDQILTRKDAADSTRNALNVLQRYRFLFNLPSSIEGNIQKQDYEQVITDYLRAKSLFSDTQVKVFERVYKEVEIKMEKFKVTLKDRLIDTCKERKSRNIDEIKRFIKHLASLDVVGNPGWEAVITIKETLLASMNECKDKYVKLLNKPEIMEPNEDLRNYSSSEESPTSVQFIDEQIEVFKNSFLDLVTLGNYYLNNELYSKDNKDQLKAKELEFTNEFIQKPIDLLVSLIRETILPDAAASLSSSSTTTKNQYSNDKINANFVRWLPHCLLITTNLYNELSLLELPCISMLRNLQTFIFDLRVHSLTCVFNQAAEEVKQMHSKENWDVNFDDNGTRTQLPLLFESKVEEILRLVRETILQVSTPDEVDIFTKYNVQGQMKQLAQNLLSSFVNTLERTSTTQNVTSPSMVLKSNPTLEARLLIVICNCQYTSNQVIPRLQENFDKYNYPDMGNVIKQVQNKFKELENKLFTAYIDYKSRKILDPIRTSMQLKNVEWYRRTSRPTAVSFYVKELLMSIIEIQADIFSMAPHLVKKIVIRIIDLTIEEISNLFDAFCSNELNKYSNLQANLDLNALKYIFDDPENFKSVNSSKVLDRCFNHLHTLHDNESEQLLDQLLNQFKNSMSLQLSSLKWRIEQVVISL